MTASNEIAKGLYDKLSGGTALTASLGAAKIYRTQAPEGATLPYVVFSHYSGGPLNLTPSDLVDELYFVRAYAISQAQAGTIDAQIGSLLHCGTVTVSGYSNYRTVREIDLEQVENLPKGAPIYMVGGIYRISLDS